jgi:tetratricopeptide (TPR) repeat protein
MNWPAFVAGHFLWSKSSWHFRIRGLNWIHRGGDFSVARTAVKQKRINPTASPLTRRRCNWRLAAWCALLAAAVALLYGRVATFQLVHYDDLEYLMKTPHVQQGLSWAGIRWAFLQTQVANWHPLTILSYLLDDQFWGFSARAFHLTNLFWHTLNTVLLFIVLRALTKAQVPSAIVAALFGIHPLHVESVAWVAERKDVLSTFFWIVTIWAYASWVRDRKTWRYALVLLLYVMGLMCKPMLVTLPFVLLLLDFWPLNRVHDNRGSSTIAKLPHLLLEKTPLFILAAISAIVTFLVQQKAGAVAIVDRVSLSERFANAGMAYLVYLGQMIWPAKLAALYPLPQHANLEWGLLCGAIVLAATAGAIVALRRWPYVAVGWLWYVGTLVPVIGIVQVGLQSHADRYTYVPLIGIFIAIVWAAFDLIDRRPQWRIPATVAAMVAITALAARTWFQIGYWADSETLFKRTLAVAPDNPQIHYNLGTVYSEQQRPLEAIAHYRQAVRLQPELTEAWCNLALTLAGQGGDLAEATQISDDLVNRAPDLADAHVAKAIVAFGRGDVDLAESSANEALKRDPKSYRAYLVLGRVDAAKGQLAVAEQQFRRAADLSVSADSYLQLGLIIGAQGRTDDAIAQFREALKWQPNNSGAHEALGHSLLTLGKLDDAKRHFAAVLDLNPRARESRLEMGTLLTRQGRIAEAIAYFEKVVQTDSGDAPAHFQLGIALQMQNRAAEAIDQYRQAIALNPKSTARNNLAWLLATHPDAHLRNGAEALLLAEQLPTSAEALDTLAAAYAETGAFDQAQVTAQQALAQAREKSKTTLIPQLESRLALYKQNQPYREPIAPSPNQSP